MWILQSLVRPQNAWKILPEWWGGKCSNISGWRLKDPNDTWLILVVSVVEKVARDSETHSLRLETVGEQRGALRSRWLGLFMVHLNPSSSTVLATTMAGLGPCDPLKTQRQRPFLDGPHQRQMRWNPARSDSNPVSGTSAWSGLSFDLYTYVLHL